MSIRNECVREVLDAIVGSTSPEGDSYLDGRNQKNIDAFGEVCDWVADRLDKALACRDSQFFSMRQTATMTIQAAEYLTDTINEGFREDDE